MKFEDTNFRSVLFFVFCFLFCLFVCVYIFYGPEFKELIPIIINLNWVITDPDITRIAAVEALLYLQVLICKNCSGRAKHGGLRTHN